MILEIKDICKSFHQTESGILEVLKHINFGIKAGETNAITGHSGSGKTTLLSLIAGLDSPDSGEILLDGENLSAMNQGQLSVCRARKIGIVFQQFHLMPHLSARENISLPLEILNQGRRKGLHQGRSKDHIQDQTSAMLENVGLGLRQNHLPGQLSRGECQRVAIARALIIRPALLLADEPTGNLDMDTGEKVAQLLFDLVEKENKTLILVTHNPDLANQCQKIRRLERGTLL